MPKKQKLEILFTGAELKPLVKVGGLGDVMGSLPKALNRLGVTVKIIIPFYGMIDKKLYKATLVKKNISIQVEDFEDKFDLYKTSLPGSRINVYLIKHKLFDGKQIYSGGRKYLKGNVYSREIGDVERFVFFSKAVAETIQAMKWVPDVIHCHDWHSALLPTFIDEYSLTHKNFKNIRTLFTIHNLANQGITGLDIVDYAGLHNKLTPALMEDYYDKDGQVIDLMKVGILSADFVNTVSPNYAKEILTKEYGERLEKYLLRRQKHLFGIINGISSKAFNPKTDKAIAKQYTAKTITAGKAANKEALQAELKLPVDAKIPIFGMVSRLVKQKGVDILAPALKKFLKNDAQVVILGTGQAKYEQELKALTHGANKKLKVKIMFDADLARRIYAGSDFFLMPSAFEPCGLGQMISMRYGTIPLVRKTGGLKDTVIHNKTGVVFSDYTQAAMLKNLNQALNLYKNKTKFNKIRISCLRQDFSWEKSAKEYLKLYNKLK